MSIEALPPAEPGQEPRARAHSSPPRPAGASRATPATGRHPRADQPPSGDAANRVKRNPDDDRGDRPGPPLRSGLSRWLLLALGVAFTALGLVGAFLPVLPTTPFVLLAAACFVRSSPSFHRRLLASPVFGRYVAQWQRDGTVPAEAKRKAYGLVLVTFALSIALVDPTWLRASLVGIGLGLIAFLAWLPTTGER